MIKSLCGYSHRCYPGYCLPCNGSPITKQFLSPSLAQKTFLLFPTGFHDIEDIRIRCFYNSLPLLSAFSCAYWQSENPCLSCNACPCSTLSFGKWKYLFLDYSVFHYFHVSRLKISDFFGSYDSFICLFSSKCMSFDFTNSSGILLSSVKEKRFPSVFHEEDPLYRSHLSIRVSGVWK